MRFSSRLSGRQRQQALSRIARASTNPAVAFELRWADVTRDNRGMRRFADEAAEEIELKADLKTTLIPAVQQWIGLNATVEAQCGGCVRDLR